MPKKVVKALMRKGMSKDKAYAIAYGQVKNRLKVKKKAK
jgi:hypothetical protein